MLNSRLIKVVLLFGLLYTAVSAHAATPVVTRIDVGGDGFTDSKGQPWAKDYGFNTGLTVKSSLPVSGTEDDVLYQTQRYDLPGGDELAYAFTVPNGTYQVNLLFAETFVTAVGQRVFHVDIEGVRKKADLDIFAAVGANWGSALLYTIEVTDGQLNIGFVHKTENPTLSAIEIIGAATTVQSPTLQGEFSGCPVFGTKSVALAVTTSPANWLTFLAAPADTAYVVATWWCTDTGKSHSLVSYKSDLVENGTEVLGSYSAADDAGKIATIKAGLLCKAGMRLDTEPCLKYEPLRKIAAAQSKLTRPASFTTTPVVPPVSTGFVVQPQSATVVGDRPVYAKKPDGTRNTTAIAGIRVKGNTPCSATDKIGTTSYRSVKGQLDTLNRPITSDHYAACVAKP